MERIENHRAVLDRGAGVCAVFADDIETEVSGLKPGIELAGKQVLVVGLARTGVATALFCAARGARVTATEERPESQIAETAAKLRAAGVTLELGGHRAETFVQQDLIVPSPRRALSLMPRLAAARAIGIPVWSEIELAWRFLRGRLVCITGSNGKTTTTSLVGHILETAGLPVQVAGNIGTPLISRVDVSSDAGFTVVEASSFQLESISAFVRTLPCCSISRRIIWTGTDRSKQYGRAKARMFENQTEEDAAILNADDATVAQYAPSRRRFSGSAGRNAWPADVSCATTKLFSGAMALRRFSCKAP